MFENSKLFSISFSQLFHFPSLFCLFFAISCSPYSVTVKVTISNSSIWSNSLTMGSNLTTAWGWHPMRRRGPRERKIFQNDNIQKKLEFSQSTFPLSFPLSPSRFLITPLHSKNLILDNIEIFMNIPQKFDKTSQN